MTERGIVVKGSSIEDALQKGVALLGADRAHVSYEVLQHGATRPGTLVATPFKLRVTVGGISAQPADPSPFVSAESTLGAHDVETLSPAEFLLLLDQIAARIQALGPEEGRATERDGEVLVEVAPDRMAAYVTITPARGGREMTFADAQAALVQAGVRWGVDEEALRGAVADGAARCQVATGCEARPGTDARLQFMSEDGSPADDCPTGRTVAAETVVAVKTAAAEGVPGRDVLGGVLPPLLGRDLPLQARKGKNVRVSPDGQALIATSGGVVSFIDGRVHVETALVLERDLTSESGALEFSGDIVVHGSILRGVSVTATGNITVDGNIEVAVVQAGGSVFVGGGVLGRGMGTVRARGNITCRFLEGANIRAGGDVVVEDYIRGGDVRADRRVLVEGTVVGGHVYGASGVRVRISGTEQGTPTTLVAGGVLRVREETERIRTRLAALAERLALVEAMIAPLLSEERRGRRLPTSERLEAAKAVEERARLQSETEFLAKKKSELTAQVDASRPAAVYVTHTAHARTRILIDDTALELPAPTQYAKFTKDGPGSGIRVAPLT